jgi:membrane protein implicated in regulation of membrane protease activity
MSLRKRKKSWPARILFKYLLIQLPGWALWTLALILVQHWIHFPGWIIPLFVAVWVGKDIIMFPFVWRAYDSEHGQKSHPRAGDRGVVVKRLSPQGYVRIDGELWRAEVAGEKGSAFEGETVGVIDVQGLTLIVEPVSMRSKDSDPTTRLTEEERADRT